MVAVQIVSWIVIGGALGAASVHFSTSKAVGLAEALAMGVLGALLGGSGFARIGSVAGSAVAGLVMSAVGAIFLLGFHWAGTKRRKREQRNGGTSIL